MKRPGYDHLLKLIIIGDSSVGKTCILLRFSEDNFPTSHMPTIGIDFKIKSINVDSQVVKLQVWDTAGQERFRTITQTYYKGAMGIILAYDCTDENSFSNIRNWIKQIETHAAKDVAKVLVGNKCDKQDEKVISAEQGQQLADEYGLKFFETSALSGHNINDLFYDIAQTIVKSKPAASTSTQSAPTRLTGVEKSESSKEKKCCG